MTSYITKPLSVKKTDIFRSSTLSPSTYRKINYKNKNVVLLEKLLTDNKKGYEFGSDNYIKFSKNYFIRISDLSNNEFIVTETDKTLKVKPPLIKKPILKNGDICYQTASNVGNVCFYFGNNAYYNSHIRRLNFKDNKYYVFAMLKSSFCKNQVDIGGSIKGVDNFSEDKLLNTLIPFPTKANNINPNNIEYLVSNITQNILDKEKHINLKNKLIDNKINDELNENQCVNSFKHKYPKLSDLKKEKRLDTITYTAKYKDLENLIYNYSNGYYFLDEENISPGRTPKDYYYSNTKKSSLFYEWITPKNIKGRTLDYKTYIYTKTDTRISKTAIVLNGIRYVGNGVYIDNDEKIYSNQNTLIIQKFDNEIDQLFLYTFLTSNIGKYMQMAQRNFGIVPILYTDNLCKIPIPKLGEVKKKEIIKFYYNPVKKNGTYTIENYLKNEFVRNRKLGIHQLNSEIFELKENLETLIDSIVMDKKINIGNFLG